MTILKEDLYFDENRKNNYLKQIYKDNITPEMNFNYRIKDKFEVLYEYLLEPFNNILDTYNNKNIYIYEKIFLFFEDLIRDIILGDLKDSFNDLEKEFYINKIYSEINEKIKNIHNTYKIPYSCYHSLVREMARKKEFKFARIIIKKHFEILEYLIENKIYNNIMINNFGEIPGLLLKPNIGSEVIKIIYEFIDYFYDLEKKSKNSTSEIYKEINNQIDFLKERILKLKNNEIFT